MIITTTSDNPVITSISRTPNARAMLLNAPSVQMSQSLAWVFSAFGCCPGEHDRCGASEGTRSCISRSVVGWLDFVDARMNHHRDNRIHVVGITPTPTVAFVKSPTIDHIVAHTRPCFYAGVSTPDKPKCGSICDTYVCGNGGRSRKI